MLNKQSLQFGKVRSPIRELFEYGLELKRKGIEVCDFTLGNPNSPVPEKVLLTLIKEVKKSDLSVFGYTSQQGDDEFLTAVANSLNKKSKIVFTKNDIIATTGAAGALTAVIGASISSKKDEILVLTPCFPDYKIFIEGAGGKCVEVKYLDDFDIDFSDLKKKINKHTKALIMNFPNNPTGQIISEKSLNELSSILKKYGVMLISDEPYREIVFGKEKVPFPPSYYSNTVICYSFSKSMSIPGERIGYVAISPNKKDKDDFRLACLGHIRKLGYVCAPSLFQHVIAKTIDEVADVKLYKENLDVLTKHLQGLGFSCNSPKGAFYLMLKSPDGDGERFSSVAKSLGLLLVPTKNFGAKEYVRLATCVSKETVQKSLPKFTKLKEIY